MRLRSGKALLLLAVVLLWGCAKPEPPPSLLIYLVDTLRADHLGCYGYAGSTSPNIDRFATESVVFERALSSSSWTRPAVASLLTGLYPQAHGARARSDRLADAQATLPELLSDAGYETAAVITNGNTAGRFGFNQGFDVFRYLAERPGTPEVHRLSDEVNEVAFEWLADRSRDRPFFLYLHTTDPHAPYTPRPEAIELVPAADLPQGAGTIGRIKGLTSGVIPYTEEVREELIALYDAEIAFNDHHFGRLLEELRRLDLYDSTIIAVVSDHGEEFHERGYWQHGRTLFDEQLLVPLIMRFPGGPVGRVAEAVSLVDVLPTLVESATGEAPASLHGRSLHPLMRNSASGEARPAFADLFTSQRTTQAVVAEGHKLIRMSRGESRNLVRVFDLESDPGETESVRTTAPEVTQRLKQLLEATDQAWSAPPGTPVVIDGELERVLEALGYVN